MDYKEYYSNQIKNQTGAGLPVFTGYANQRGYGIGGIFRKLSSYILPYVKSALPFIKKGGQLLGSEVVRAASSIATDAINGKDLETSARENITEAVNNLSQKANTVLQTGSGKYKGRKKRKKNNSKKHFIKHRRLEDVFDRK